MIVTRRGTVWKRVLENNELERDARHVGGSPFISAFTTLVRFL